MIFVELYSKDDCHLCDKAKEVLLKVQLRYPFEFKEIKIHEGDQWYEQYKERIPVVHINKNFAFQYRVPEKEFLSKLQHTSL